MRVRRQHCLFVVDSPDDRLRWFIQANTPTEAVIAIWRRGTKLLATTRFGRTVGTSHRSHRATGFTGGFRVEFFGQWEIDFGFGNVVEVVRQQVQGRVGDDLGDLGVGDAG